MPHALCLAILLSFGVVEAYAGECCDSLMRIQRVDNASSGQLVELLEACRKECDGTLPAVYCAKALDLFAWYMIQHDSKEKSLKLLEDARDYCPKDSGTLYHSIISGLAGVCMYNEDYDNAARMMAEVLDYHRNTGNERETMVAYANLGTLYGNMNNGVRALEAYGKALEIASASEQYDDYHCFLLLFIAKQNADDASTPELINKSIDIAFKNNLVAIQPQNYIALAEYYYRQSDYERALSNADKALQFATKTGNTSSLIDCHRMLGKIYDMLGRYELAANSYKRLDEVRVAFENERVHAEYAEEQRAYELLLWCRDNASGRYKASSSPVAMTALLGTATVVLALLVAVLWRRKRESVVNEEQTAETESVSDNEEHIRQLAKIRRLSLFYDNHNVVLERIRTMLRQLKGNTAEQAVQLKKINQYISQSLVQKKDTDIDELAARHDEMFLNKLSELYPAMTEGEKRIALYMRLDLSSRDIALLTGTQLNSVKMGRYRLRKTMRLSPEDDMTAFLRSI